MSQNFPTALNNGTTLANSRSVNDTIPASDHNDLANAQIAVETKLGYGSSTPTNAGYVLTSLGSGQSAWQAASGGSGGSPTFINAKTYGAVGDGTADDTAAIQSAITAALATRSGTAAVYLPAGKYNISATLNCSSATSSNGGGKGVFLVGDGRQATRIAKTGNFIGAYWQGFGGPAGNPTAFGGMRNITIDGGAHTGAAARVVGGQQMEFFASSIISNNDVGLDLQCTQDSYFYDLTFNNCGSTTLPVINIYGDADGTANMLWFSQIRVETFLNGAVWIKRGAGATGGGNNGFFFSQCKFENYPTVHGDVFVADNYTQQLAMQQIFISIGLYDSGYSTPANGILFGDGTSSSPALNQASFRDIFMNAGPTAGIANSVIKLNGGGVVDGPIIIDNVSMTAACTTGIIVMAGMSNADVQTSHIAGPSPKFGGDKSGVPTVVGTATLTAGAVTITSSRVNSSSRIFLTRKGSNAQAGTLYVGTITDYTSFVVNSTNASDTGTFHYWIVT